MNAVVGDLVTAKAHHRGIAGFVVDGYIRDLPGILGIGFPVYDLQIEGRCEVFEIGEALRPKEPE